MKTWKKGEHEGKKYSFPFILNLRNISKNCTEKVYLEYSDALLMVFNNKKSKRPNVCFSKFFDSKSIQL